MKVTLEKSKINFNVTEKDFVAEGGQGKVYLKDKKALKIFFNPKEILPSGKMDELSRLQHKNILKPEEFILENGKIIGYSMPASPKETLPLVQTFPKAYKDRNNLDTKAITNIILMFRALIADEIHSKDILVVDLNEMNFLISKKHNEIFAIDVDSYQTPSYPATAIMESIQDIHTQGFSKETDWFSFAILSFQLFSGVHPYKGRHQIYKTMQERMKHNTSVFNSSVGIPPFVKDDISKIPSNWTEWYRNIFDDGKRFAPPVDVRTAAVIPMQAVVLKSSARILLNKVGEYNNVVVRVTESFVFTKDEVVTWDNKRTEVLPGELIQYKNEVFLKAKKEKNNALNINNSIRSFFPELLMVTSNHNRLIGKQGSMLVEYLLRNDIVTIKSLGSTLENSTHFFENFTLQESSTRYIYTFLEESGQVQILADKFASIPVLGKYIDGLLGLLVTDKLGNYKNIFYRLDGAKLITLGEFETDIPALNFTVLPAKNMLVVISAPQQLNVITSDSKIIEVSDSVISEDMQLFSRNNEVMFYRGKEIWRMNLR